MDEKAKVLRLLRELETIDETGEFKQVTSYIEGLLRTHIKNAKTSQFCENMSRLDEQAESEKVEMIKLWYNITLKIKQEAQRHYIENGCDISEEVLEQIEGAIAFMKKQKKKKIQPRETTIETLIDWFSKSEKIADLKHKADILAIKIGIT